MKYYPNYTEVHIPESIEPDLAAATAWLQLLPTIRRLIPRWLANAGYRSLSDDQQDIIAEAGLRFLSSFNPGKSNGVGSTLVYAKRCCLSAYRKLFPLNDVVTTALRSHPRIESVIDDRAIEDVNGNVPALSDLSSKLSKRVSWFAAHPKMVSRQVQSRLRREISGHIQSAAATPHTPRGSPSQNRAEGDGKK